MSGTDHPPSTTSPTHPPRRALATALAIALTILVAVVLASASGGRGLASAAVPEAPAQSADELTSRTTGRATLADLEEIAEAVAPPTTTTTVAPPPTTTTTTTAPPAPAPPPAPQPTASGTGYNDPNNPAAWDRLAGCESGGNWAINTGNGYYGGIQFSLSSWRAVGGTGYPHEHSRETQIAMGQRLWQQGGWAHWPGCTRHLGYR